MMKNLLIALSTLVTLGASAQNGLTNLSFETWTTTIAGQMPVGWFGMTVNHQTTGAQNGSSYARIVTTTSTGPTADGFMGLGNINIMGAPYTQRPISLNGFYKTSGLAAGDSVNIFGF